MNGRRVTLVFAFLVALAAGLAAGVLASRLPMSSRSPDGPHSQLAEQLQLSPEQSDQMKSIWEGTRDSLDDCFSAARNLQQERDDAVVGLLTPEQKAQYARINQEYVNGFAEVTARRQAAFDKAVKRTEQMLTEPQKKKYHEILRSRMGEGGALGPVRLGADDTPKGQPSVQRGATPVAPGASQGVK